MGKGGIGTVVLILSSAFSKFITIYASPTISFKRALFIESEVD